MNCVFVVETSCCTNNCSKAEDEKTSLEEFEVGDTESDEEEEEEIDKASVQTCFKFPDKWRP